MSRAGKPITHDGITYPSHSALARSFGVTHGAVFSLKRTGSLAGLGRCKATGQPSRSQPVASLGHYWPSQKACAEDLSVTPAAVSLALERGYLDRLVRERIGDKS